MNDSSKCKVSMLHFIELCDGVGILVEGIQMRRVVVAGLGGAGVSNRLVWVVLGFRI